MNTLTKRLTKRLTKTLMVLALVMVGVIGCHSNNNDDNGITTSNNLLSDLASQAADSEPGELDSAALRANINALFNGMDGDPVEIETDDTIQAVINSASGI